MNKIIVVEGQNGGQSEFTQSTLRIYDSQLSKPAEMKISFDYNVTCMTLSHDSNYLAIGHEPGCVSIYLMEHLSEENKEPYKMT